MKVYSNTVVQVSNYNTDALDRALSKYGQHGYKLVSTEIAPNKYGVNVMFLFFAKEIEQNEI